MRAGFYECEITPPLGCNMPGYYRPNPAQDVFERLYAKAVVVEDAGRYAAIVALDTCEVNPQFHEEITRRVEAYTGLDPACVCVHVVHTHKGAPTEDRPEVGQFYDAPYTDVCTRLAADAITLAYRRMRDVEVVFGEGRVEGISFNRNYILEGGKAVSFGSQGKRVLGMLAGTDPSLPVMTFLCDGQPIGSVISFACHQDCTGREVNGYSADYSGILAQELKREYGQDFVSVFLIGTAGDINHIPTDSTRKLPPFWYREMGKMLAREAIRVMQDSEPVGEGVETCKEPITLPLRVLDDACVARQVEAWKGAYASEMRTRNLLHYHQTNRAREDTLLLQAIRIGNTCIYVFPGEIYVNFGLRIKASTRYAHCMVIENSNSFGGYVPTPEAFAPEHDLYETSLCEGSRHTSDAGDRMTDRLLKMGEQLK